MNELLIAAILGIVEGLTEFLPVSSTGHMIIVGHWLGFTGAKAETFEIMIQLGAILAVVVLYWRKLFGLIGIHFGAKIDRSGASLNLVHILLGMLPAVVLGLLLHSQIKALFTPTHVAYALIAGAIFLVASEKFHTKISAQTIDQISYKQAFLVGCFQCLALYPGFSRSGATIAGGLMIGLSRKAAAEFSFILAVPMMMGATILDVYKNFHVLSTDDIGLFVVGFVMAFIVALLAIKTFISLIEHITFIPFAIYRTILAVVILYFVFI